jgi:hypothetical protein
VIGKVVGPLFSAHARRLHPRDLFIFHRFEIRNLFRQLRDRAAMLGGLVLRILREVELPKSRRDAS